MVGSYYKTLRGSIRSDFIATEPSSNSAFLPVKKWKLTRARVPRISDFVLTRSVRMIESRIVAGKPSAVSDGLLRFPTRSDIGMYKNGKKYLVSVLSAILICASFTPTTMVNAQDAAARQKIV